MSDLVSLRGRVRSIRSVLPDVRALFKRATNAARESARRGKLLETFDIIEYKLGNTEDLAVKKYLRQEAASLSPELLNLCRLVRVTPERRFAGLHSFMVSKEAVHALKGGVEELKRYRLAPEGFTKDSICLGVKNITGWRPFAQISRVYMQAARDNEGRIDVTTLPGDVDSIVMMEPKPLGGGENIVGYYTVSADMTVRGAARELVQRLDEVNEQGRLETTISPIREMDGYISKNTILDIHDIDGPDAAREQILRYLMRKNNSVANFHLGNGAMIGWIHFNPNSEKDWIVMNYVYDRSLLKENKALYQNGELPVSEALYRATGQGNVVQSQRLQPVVRMA